MNATRRDVLTAFLGAPAALAACRMKPRIPEGELVFQSERFGHRLRDGVTVTPWNVERTGVVIVGGGVAGLSAAWSFARAGFNNFVLVELERAPGGTARGGSGPHGAYPWGAHYITTPMRENRALIALLNELGALDGLSSEGDPVVKEQLLCRDPQERIFQGGAWHEGLYLRAGASPQDLAELAAFKREIDRWSAWRDARGRRAFAIPMATGSDDAEVTALDQISLREWMNRQGFTSPRLRWLADYACKDDYGSTSGQTSAWAGIFYFASRQRSPGAEAQAIITWPEGNSRLTQHLYASVRDRVRLGLAASELIPTERGVDVTALSEEGRGLTLRADQALFAAPQFLTRYLVRPYRDSPPDHIAEFRYGAWMVANLTLRKRPKNHGFPLSWDNVIYDSPSLGYVVNTHQQLVDHGPTVWTYYHPLCDDDPKVSRQRLLSAGRDAWADVSLTDLESAHPGLRSLVTRLDVVRWGHAMIRPRVGFIWGGARAAASRPFRGIHFAHSDLSGVALFEEAFHHGVRAAEEILRARGIEYTAIS